MVRVLTGEVVVSRRVATLVTRLFVHWLDSPKMRKKAQMNRVLEVSGNIRDKYVLVGYPISYPIIYL